MHHRRSGLLVNVRTSTLILFNRGTQQGLIGIACSLRHHDPAGVHLLQAECLRFHPSEGFGEHPETFPPFSAKLTHSWPGQDSSVSHLRVFQMETVLTLSSFLDTTATASVTAARSPSSTALAGKRD